MFVNLSCDVFVLLFRFLPHLTRTAFEEELSSLGVTITSPPHTSDGLEQAVTCKTCYCCSVLSHVWRAGTRCDL